MDQIVGIAGWAGLIALGAVIGWAMRLYWNTHRRPSHRMIACLDLFVWPLVYVGTIGLLISITLPPATSIVPWLLVTAPAVLVAGSVVKTRYRQQESRRLLWQMGAALRRQTGVRETIETFASRRFDELGMRAEMVADGIERGMPLARAFARANWRLPTEGLLAIELNYAADDLGATFQDCAERASRFSLTSRHAVRLVLYLLLLTAAITYTITFVFVKIIPTFEQIFIDFEVELPPVTLFMIEVGNEIASRPLLLALSYGGLLLVLLASWVWAVYYLGWEPLAIILLRRLRPNMVGPAQWEPFFFRRLLRPYHGALIMGSLASVADSRQSLVAALKQMAKIYPTADLRRPLRDVVAMAESGGNLFDGFVKHKLLDAQVASMLNTAARVGNLAWALREMSETAIQRHEVRNRMIMRTLSVVLTLIMAIPVALVVIGLITPLIQLTLTLG